MNHHSFTDQCNDHLWMFFQVYLATLRRTHGLDHVLTAVDKISHDRGFIRDRLTDAVLTALVDDDQRYPAFIAQHNKRRGARGEGAGRKTPPPGRQWINDGCFLCRTNYVGQNCGLEMGYVIELGGSLFTVLPNPHPFHPEHFTVAAGDHVPQDWSRGAEQLLTEMTELSCEARERVVMWNSRDAGASIPSHFHYHEFSRWHGYRLPLEVAAADIPRAKPAIVENYPGSIVAVRGSKGEVVDELAPVIQRWLNDHQETAALNLMVTGDPDHDDLTLAFFCARDRNRSRLPGINGIVGGLEVAGELIFSTPEEKNRLDCGEINHAFAAHIIASVQAPQFRQYFNQIMA